MTSTRDTTELLRYDEDVLAANTNLRTKVVVLEDLVPDGGRSAQALGAAFDEAQAAVRADLSGATVSKLPEVAAWRAAFSRFGATPSDHRSAPEALLRRLSKGGSLPSITPLVDLGNRASITHRVAVALFDLDVVDTPVVVHHSRGGEPFHGIGRREPEACEAGEVVFTDGDGVVLARRWCWRQAQHGAVGPSTTRAMAVVEAHHAGAAEDVAAAVALVQREAPRG